MITGFQVNRYFNFKYFEIIALFLPVITLFYLIMQFAPDDSEKVMITSADSKIRIVDGADVIQKYRGSIWFNSLLYF